MKRRDEGHPLGALFVLSSMFAFAFVFHIVTKFDPQLPARFDLQLAALVAPTAAVVPEVPEVPVAPKVHSVRVALSASATPGTPGTLGTLGTLGTPQGTQGTLGTPGTIGTSGTALPSRAWSIPAALPAPLSANEPNGHSRDGGALTRAFATAGSAVRNALRKTF